MILFFSFAFLQKGDEKDASQNRLASLGYIAWSDVEEGREGSGVVLHDGKRAFQGYNLFHSEVSPNAYLMDMEGNIVHKWTLPGHAALNHVEPIGNCSVYLMVKDEGIYLLDGGSRIVSSYRTRAHHDLEVTEDGRVYALSRKGLNVPGVEGKVRILDDRIVEIGKGGRLRRRISVWRLFGHMVSDERLGLISLANETELAEDYEPDVFHTNTVEVLSHSIGGIADRGDLLISIRELDAIAIIDPMGERIKWMWGPGILSKQHRPTLLDDGNILVFDNGRDRNRSRAVIVDPRTRKIVWEYGDGSYTDRMGAAQKLPNGNMLLTDSRNGRAYEITGDGERVWEFLNFEMQDIGNATRRGTIHHMRRIPFDPCNLERMEEMP